MAKFPIASCSIGSPGTGVTTFLAVAGASVGSSTTETSVQIPVSEAGTISEFDFMVPTAPGAGAQWLITLRINGVDTAATVTIAGTNTVATPWTGSISFADGDILTISMVPTGTPAASVGYSSVLWLNTASANKFWMGAYIGSASNAADSYFPLSGLANTTATTDGTAWCMPASGSINRLRALTRAGDPGGGAKQYAVSARQNGADVLTATVAGTNTTALATGTVAFALGDLIEMHAAPGSTPTSRGLSWCVSYSTTNPGDSIMGHGGGAAAGTGNTTTFSIPFGGSTASTYGTQATRALPIAYAFQIKGLITKLAVAPGGAATRTINMLSNGANTGLTTGAITGATTQQQDTVNTINLTANTGWALRYVWAGAPADPGVGGGGTALINLTLQPRQAPTHNVTISDAATRSATLPRTATDSVTVSDSASRSSTLPRTAQDTVSVSDTAFCSTGHPRTAADTVAVSDTATRQLTAPRTAADTVAVSDQAGSVDTLPRTATDSVSVSDAADRAAISRARFATDTVTVTDSASRVVFLPRTAADVVALSDAASRSTTLPRTAADLVSISDTATRLQLLATRLAFDIVTVTDQAAAATLANVTAGDLVLISDTATAEIHIPGIPPGHFEPVGPIAHWTGSAAPGRILGGPPGHFEDLL